MKSLRNKGLTCEKLKDNLNNYQSLIEALPHPVVIIDIDFNIVAANKKIAELYGFNGDMLTKKCFQIFHGADKPVEHCPLLKGLSKDVNATNELHIPVFNKYLVVKTAPLLDGANIIGSIHSFFDITDYKKKGLTSDEVIDVLASAIIDMKSREIKTQQVRDAFFNMLEDINESYQELEDLFMKLVRVMVNALDAKSPWTKGHSERVSIYSEEIAKEMKINEDDIKEIKLAGLLHDIGKIGTYDYLLEKPGALTKDEFELVKKHPEQGVRILKDIKQLSDIIPLIKHHHEKLDGTGYPSNLKDSEIPIGAKILHVADSFDSMTSDRPYRKAPGVEFALSELKKFKGIQFDNKIVDAFMKVLKKTNTL